MITVNRRNREAKGRIRVGKGTDVVDIRYAPMRDSDGKITGYQLIKLKPTIDILCWL